MRLTPQEPDSIPPSHYYGDTVRSLFLAATLLTLLLAQFDQIIFDSFLFIGICVLLLLVVLAGFTSPTRKLSIVADTVVSGILFIAFQYLALLGSHALGDLDIVFTLRQALAILFLFALYFGVKSWRGMP